MLTKKYGLILHTGNKNEVDETFYDEKTLRLLYSTQESLQRRGARVRDLSGLKLGVSYIYIARELGFKDWNELRSIKLKYDSETAPTRTIEESFSLEEIDSNIKCFEKFRIFLIILIKECEEKIVTFNRIAGLLESEKKIERMNGDITMKKNVLHSYLKSLDYIEEKIKTLNK